MVALVKGDSILQLTEGGHRSLATEHFSKSVQRNDKRDIGLAVAGHIGGAVTKGTGVDRDFECPPALLFRTYPTNKLVFMSLLSSFFVVFFLFIVFTTVHRVKVDKFAQEPLR